MGVVLNKERETQIAKPAGHGVEKLNPRRLNIMAGALSVAMGGTRKRRASSRKKNTSHGRGRKTQAIAKRRTRTPGASYARLKNAVAKNAANTAEVGGEAGMTVITQGTLALSAYAAGYMGQGKMRIQANNAFTDYRVLGGAALAGLGLFGAMQGKHQKDGMRDNYMLALGSGLIAGPVYEAAYSAGYTMAEKNDKLGGRTLAGKRKGFAGTRPVMVSGFGEDEWEDDEAEYDDFGQEPVYSRLSRG
jgi:hypothetical protein